MSSPLADTDVTHHVLVDGVDAVKIISTEGDVREPIDVARERPVSLCVGILRVSS